MKHFSFCTKGNKREIARYVRNNVPFLTKKITLFCSALLALLVTVSCKDEIEPVTEVYVPGSPSEVVLKASIAAASEGNVSLMTDLKWSENDSIGLFVKLGGDFISAGYLPVTGSLSSDGRSGDFFGSLHWERSALQHNFYAYYPKRSDVNDATKIPISLPDVQTQNGTTNTHLSDLNVLIAKPKMITSPKDITKPELNKAVTLDFVSVFSTVEFRFASYKENDLLINKITIKSDNGDFTVDEGFLDLTKGDFEIDYAKIYGGVRKDSITLIINDPIPVPVSGRKSIIPGNDGSKPADITKVFPASLMVLPNINVSYKDTAKFEEKWAVTLETNKGNFNRTFTRRSMRPGERYIVEYVVLTTDDGSGNTGNPDDEYIGDPWSGRAVQPTDIDNNTKTILIYEPGELAWVAEIINKKIPYPDMELGVDSFFRGYTLRLENNINLGGAEWTPIGNAVSYQDCFQGTLDGRGHLISNLTIRSAHEVDGYANVGLFGYSGAKAIKDVKLRNAVIGPINLANFNSSFVGGFVGYSPAYHATAYTNCSFEGTIEVSTGTHIYPVGGIVGFAEGGSITGCSSSAKIKGNSMAKYSATADMGGIVGRSTSRIKACQFTGELNGTGSWNIGGIVGYTSGGSIVASKNTGKILCDGTQAQLGGIAGDCRCDIIACYNTGSVAASGDASAYGSKGIGGIVGIQYTGSTLLGVEGYLLKACYSTGKTSGTRGFANYTGNIIGQYSSFVSSLGASATRITNNYYTQGKLTSDTPPDQQPGRITRFGQTAWPNSGMNGWGIGDGSGDNKYWNDDFPINYGTIYPTLYWEIIE